MFILLLTLIFVRPFISSFAFPYIDFIYSALLLASGAIWIITKGINPDGIKPIRYPLMLFILALVVSCLASGHALTSIKESSKYIMGIMLLCIGISLSETQKDKVILCLVLAGVLISLIAIYQYYFGFSHLGNYMAKKNIIDPFASDYLSRRRPFATFVTPNTLGGYLAMVLVLGLAQKNKLWFIIPIFLGLLLTKSVGAFFSLFIGFAFYFYLQDNLKKKGILLLAGLLIVIVWVIISRDSFPRIHTYPIFSAAMRLNYWQDTLDLIKMRPWLGVGLGNFNLVYTRYAHNSYLQLWAEMGFLGIASFIWLVIALFGGALTRLKESPYKFKVLALITANIVFLAHNCVDFTLFLPEVSLIWWVILGFFDSTLTKARQTPMQGNRESECVPSE